jgi:5'-methylthioadenosine phosphorylase
MPEISVKLAIIGGSGLYNISGFQDQHEYFPDTPFGKPSAPIIIGNFADHPIAFLARHGIGHTLMPGEVPYRANIFALKTLGVERILSISACGSLREDYAPGHIVIPDQLFDNTKGRPHTFFGQGLVAHIGTADPFCEDLSNQLEQAVRKTDAVVHRGGSLLVIEGPRFSTKAESRIYRSLELSLIGMTAAPEAFLAREAEMCYAIMAHVTDYDVWHDSQAPVTVEMVTQTLAKNTKVAQAAILNLVRSFKTERACQCEHSLASALITQRGAIPQETMKNLQIFVKKYMRP